jgi:hypothetical protein
MKIGEMVETRYVSSIRGLMFASRAISEAESGRGRNKS